MEIALDLGDMHEIQVVWKTHGYLKADTETIKLFFS